MPTIPPSQPQRKLLIEHQGDAYEFLVRGSTEVVRILKFIGTSGMEREVDYVTLPLAVKEKLHAEI